MADWAELFAVDDRATPFQSPAWARAWDWDWAGQAEPWILVARMGDRPAGILPLWRHRTLGLRMLTTSGDPGDYCDLVARPDVRVEVSDAFARELEQRRSEWDVLVLRDLVPGSATPAALDRVGLRRAHESALACPLLELPDSFDAYLRSLPSRRRTNLRRYMRKLDDGELELRVVTDDEITPAVDRWQELRVRQWRAGGKRLLATHADGSVRALLLDALTDLVPAGLALIWEFVRDGKVVGSFINLCDDRAFYQYLGALEPELANFGIGKIATGEAIRQSIAAGRACYDFTRGSEPYKYWYGAVDRFSSTVVFGSGTARSVLAGGYGAMRRPMTLVGGRARAAVSAVQR
jgi:CelD/BcsL family acetyltransferase involved in cellulose biosynthesis